MKSFLIIALALVAAVAARKVDYSGHMVISVVPENETQLRYLLDMQSGAFDFWGAPAGIGKSAELRVSPESYYEVSRSLNSVGLSHTIRFSDVGKLMEDEQRAILLRRAIHDGKAFDFLNYHTLAEINAFLADLASTSPLVSTSVIGKTYENRDIIAARVGTGGANKKIMYYDCVMHAREWVATATCLWMINELATKYDTDPEIKAILDFADWVIAPVSNPDGYEYTWTTDRLWRKNRAPTPGAVCIGTDPNRNFDANWSGPGASGQPCSDTFYGAAPFSALEAAAMRDYLAANRGNVVASISIHAFSQFWMSPYGINSSLPVDYPEQYRVMDIAVKALEATYGTKFSYGSIANVIYQASGSTADYTYLTDKILYSYALELRDTGLYGFELPPSQILPTATETFNGLKAMAKEIANKYRSTQ